MRNSKLTLGFPTLGVPHLCGPVPPSPVGAAYPEHQQFINFDGKLDVSQQFVKLSQQKMMKRGDRTSLSDDFKADRRKIEGRDVGASANDYSKSNCNLSHYLVLTLF